jgi:hypothetical protein
VTSGAKAPTLRARRWYEERLRTPFPPSRSPRNCAMRKPCRRRFADGPRTLELCRSVCAACASTGRSRCITQSTTPAQCPPRGSVTGLEACWLLPNSNFPACGPYRCHFVALTRHQALPQPRPQPVNGCLTYLMLYVASKCL